MENISTMQRIKNFLLDLIFPATCLGCKRLIAVRQYANRMSRPGLCQDCLGKIKLQTGFACAFCQAAVINGMTCPFCRRDHVLSQLLVVANYEQSLVKETIKNLKYRFMRGLVEDLRPLLMVYLKKQIDRDILHIDRTLVVPVPLSTRRLKWRGFNQAEILANTIGKELGLEVAEVLKRTIQKRPQAEITSRPDRINNVKNAFTCTSTLIKDKNILLVDDISTTGSTLEECAKVLRTGGAQRISAFVFARG